MRSRFLLIPALIAATLLISATTTAATPDEETPLREFIRVTKRAGIGEVVEASIRTYSPPETKPMNPMMGMMGGSGKKIDRPTVVLVSMVHLGEKSYYQKVNEELAKADLVLYEEMGDPELSAMSGQLISKMTGLAFQGTEVKVTKTWRSADLSQESLFRAMGMDIEMLKRQAKMMKGLNIDPENMPKNPMLEAMLPTREKIIAELRNSGGANQMIPGEMGKFILHQRNAIVMSELTKATYEEHKRVVVIYGAAHMPGVEAYMKEMLGYELADTTWNDAVYAEPEKAQAQATKPSVEPARPVRPTAKPGKRVIY